MSRSYAVIAVFLLGWMPGNGAAHASGAPCDGDVQPRIAKAFAAPGSPASCEAALNTFKGCSSGYGDVYLYGQYAGCYRALWVQSLGPKGEAQAEATRNADNDSC